MSEFLPVIVLVLIPAVGNFVGGLVAEVIMVSRHRLGIAIVEAGSASTSRSAHT